jgi:hypothetical protein
VNDQGQKMVGRQRQSSGDNSANIQAQVVHVHSGVSEADVERIATHLIQSNLEKYDASAKAEIETRIASMAARVAHTLSEADSLESMADPGMQYAVITVEREYARTGDEELAENLLTLLAERSQQRERSTLRLVLDESLQVAGRLATHHADVLSLVLLTRRPRSRQQLLRLDDVIVHLAERVRPWLDHISTSSMETDAEHLAYAGCISQADGQCTMASALWQLWTVVWHKGLTEEQIPETLRPLLGAAFIPCFHDSSLWVPRAMQQSIAKAVAPEFGITEPASIEEYANLVVAERIPGWADLTAIWNDTAISHLQITTVGTAIGQANARRVLGDEQIQDLAAWL